MCITIFFWWTIDPPFSDTDVEFTMFSRSNSWANPMYQAIPIAGTMFGKGIAKWLNVNTCILNETTSCYLLSIYIYIYIHMKWRRKSKRTWDMSWWFLMYILCHSDSFQDDLYQYAIYVQLETGRDIYVDIHMYDWIYTIMVEDVAWVHARHQQIPLWFCQGSSSNNNERHYNQNMFALPWLSMDYIPRPIHRYDLSMKYEHSTSYYHKVLITVITTETWTSCLLPSWLILITLPESIIMSLNGIEWTIELGDLQIRLPKCILLTGYWPPIHDFRNVE